MHTSIVIREAGQNSSRNAMVKNKMPMFYPKIALLIEKKKHLVSILSPWYQPVSEAILLYITEPMLGALSRALSSALRDQIVFYLNEPQYYRELLHTKPFTSFHTSLRQKRYYFNSLG